jgi:hypothetical protein
MIVTASLLWGFRFSRAKDPVSGEDLELDLMDYAKVCGG